MAGSDLFTGSFDLLILKAVSWGPRHGYGIAQWLRAVTSEQLPIHEGVLYPALHRLERRGFLAEEWAATENNREAKYYHLTPLGRTHYRRERERWNAFSALMATALAAPRGAI